MDETQLAGQCPRCGRRLPADAPEGLCASCLFGAAAETLTQSGIGDDAPTMLATAPQVDGPTTGDGQRLAEGQTFGSYRVGRLLGRGGMGEVYEAEHEETGRRVALKVVRSRLHDAEDRARFLYEGRLAASVSHPHTVYIYGSEEIGEMSVITMELLPGGTLKDLVTSRGPLPPHEAVTAVLDLAGGLDAAHAAGILHRDIKPSNCFVDADGSVKVGDFGLSISTLARDAQVAASTGFEGTPQFAAPEQLQGKPLDVRADIYAVGATLFYLLTGEPPFDARDLRELVTRVTTEPPRSPRVLQPRIPAPLANVVLQCLAKDPAARPASYAALAEALRPFSASVAQPAKLGLRIVAGLVDSALLALPLSIQSAMTSEAASNGFRFTSKPLPALLSTMFGILYFAVLEGRWSASLGKRLTGLRVVGTTGVASPRQILVRTLTFYSPVLPSLLIALAVPNAALVAYMTAHPSVAVIFAINTLILSAVLFSPIRRGNGFAGWHDLVSGTRVVMRPQAAGHERLDEAPPAIDGSRSTAGIRCGPFDVLGDLGTTEAGRLLAGFDPVLRRRVWIHAVSRGTPAVDAARRDIKRASRLHWLAGRRGVVENWDVFEAPEGAALPAIAPGSQSWRQVRTWLSDLCNELASAGRDESLADLRLDRVWIRRDGRLVLLDFPAPALPGVSAGPAASSGSEHGGVLSPVALLAAVAEHGLGHAAGASERRGHSGSIPLSAASLIGRWRSQPQTPVADAARDLAAFAAAPDRVHTWRRAAPIVLMALPVILALLGSFAAIPAFRAMTTPVRFEAYALLKILADDEKGTTARRSPEDLAAIGTYLAGQHRDMLREPPPFGTSSISTEFARLSPIATRVIETHPNVSREDLSRARLRIGKDLDEIRAAYVRSTGDVGRATTVMIVLLVTIAGGLSMACSLVSALAVKGGVLSRMLGLAAIGPDGREISRLRSLARCLVGWGPLLLWIVWVASRSIKALSEMPITPAVPIGAVLLALASGAMWTIARPSRGPHDWIAGVRIVPR